MTSYLKHVLVAALVVLGSSGIARAAEVYGVWERRATGLQIELYDCEGKLCGKIVASKDEEDRKHIGTILLRNGVKSGEGRWQADMLNGPNDRAPSRGVVRQVSDTALEIGICSDNGGCDTDTWTRVAIAPYVAPMTVTVHGIWERRGTGLKIELYECAGKLCGKMVASKEERDQRYVGTMMLRNGVKSGERTWQAEMLDGPDAAWAPGGIVSMISDTVLEIGYCRRAGDCDVDTWLKVN